MNPLRRQLWEEAQSPGTFDVMVVGGGATGLGAAWDAATRGYRTLLVERGDFASGTSSRSTKLIHGGVRYLRQMNVSLVRESLHERGLLLRNAPGLVGWREFVIPVRHWTEKFYYGAGLKLYDLLAGTPGGQATRVLTRTETLARIPGLRREGLLGGISYHDGQFDDTELALALVAAIREAGGLPLNHVNCVGWLKANGRIRGARLREALTGQEAEVEAKVVINATGVFSDALRHRDQKHCENLIAASRGSHLVLPRDRLGGGTALMVPETEDGRVLFAIPWHDRVLLGTTDVATRDIHTDPQPVVEEVDYLLEHANRFLARPTERADVLGMFAGLRPLVVKAGKGGTASLPRDHFIEVSPGGLVSIVGGKWTTFRRMAEEVVDSAARVGGLPYRGARTETATLPSPSPCPGRPLHANLPVTRADVERAAREQMAEHVEDVLSRRTRCLLLDARASAKIAGRVARQLARLNGRDAEWVQAETESFRQVARQSLP